MARLSADAPQENKPVTGGATEAARTDAPKSEKDRKNARAADAASATGRRGELTPEQYDDDGWGDTPVQMRG
jgi:hypothetical protein